MNEIGLRFGPVSLMRAIVGVACFRTINPVPTYDVVVDQNVLVECCDQIQLRLRNMKEACVGERSLF